MSSRGRLQDRDKSSDPTTTLLIQRQAFKSTSSSTALEVDPHLELARSRIVAHADFSVRLAPLRPVHTGTATRRVIHHWWIPVAMVLASSLSSSRSVPSRRPSRFGIFSSSSSTSCPPRFLSLPLYPRYGLLRVRCFDRCGLVGRMVRWLAGWLNDLARIRRPRPYRSPLSVSFLAHAHKYAARIYSRLFSIHFNAQTLVIPAGRTWGAHLLHPRTRLADGQARRESYRACRRAFVSKCKILDAYE